MTLKIFFKKTLSSPLIEEFFYGLPMFIWKDLKTKEMHNTNKHGAFKSSWERLGILKFFAPSSKCVASHFRVQRYFCCFPLSPPFSSPIFLLLLFGKWRRGRGVTMRVPTLPPPPEYASAND